MLAPAITSLLLAATPSQAPPVLAGDDLAGWRADVSELERLLVEEHCDVARLIDPAEIRREAEALRARLPEMARHEAIVGLARLAAMPEDGHTGLSVWQKGTGFTLFPFWGTCFADGYFVLDAAPEHAKLVGRKVVEVDGVPVEEVLRRLMTVVSGENEHFDRYRAQGLLRSPEALHALGVIEGMEEAAFVLEDASGARETLTLVPRARGDGPTWSRGHSRRLWHPAIPLQPGEEWGFGLLDGLDGERVLYIWLNHLVDDPHGKKMLPFVRSLERFARAKSFDRTVLDLRGNGGGSANNAVPLVRFFSGHPKIDHRGRFFTLTSPATYSAAALFCGMLQNRTRTLFVGEPSGEGANLFGDATQHELPHSGLTVRISQRWWQCDVPEDRRTWMTLHLPAPRTHADFLAGRNPALDAALAYVSVEPEPAALSPADAARYVGRWRFSSWQELVVRAVDGHLSFRLRDLCSGPAWLAEVVSDLRPLDGRFATDVPGVTLLTAETSDEPIPSLIFDWRGVEKICRRLAPGESLPIERADGGNVGERPSGPTLLSGSRDRPRDIDRSAVGPALAEILAERDLYRFNGMVEERLNIAGYRFLFSGDVETALQLFEANVKLFPRSWNVHDSLGEGLLEDGNLQRSLASYRRSVELNPDNESGVDAIRRIERRL